MQTSENNRVNKTMHRKVQASVTLNRKYIKRPTRNMGKDVNVASPAKRSPKIQRFNTTVAGVSPMSSSAHPAIHVKEPKHSIQTDVAVVEQPIITRKQERTSLANETKSVSTRKQETTPPMGEIETITANKQDKTPSVGEVETVAPVAHPLQDSANAQLRQFSQAKQQTEQTPKISAKELKDRAIKKALSSASTINSNRQKTTLSKLQRKAEAESEDLGNHIHFGLGRVLLALSCTAVAVFAIVYFVNLSMPDISLRVAAMQTGIDPTYPNYVPRNFSISSITSENGKITMDFKNNSTGDMFTLVEENSSWDTNALASIYVKQEYGENYSIVREQGLTIYVSGSNAAWVNKGIVYKIQAEPGVLSNKQIRSIAVSL